MPDEVDVPIPEGAFVAEAHCATYLLGPADEQGERTVRRTAGGIEKPLGFDRCKVLTLKLGGLMEYEPAGRKGQIWRSTRVEKVTLGCVPSSTAH